MGIIGGEVLSAIVLMVAISVVVSPALLKFAIKSREGEKSREMNE